MRFLSYCCYVLWLVDLAALYFAYNLIEPDYLGLTTTILCLSAPIGSTLLTVDMMRNDTLISNIK